MNGGSVREETLQPLGNTSLAFNVCSAEFGGMEDAGDRPAQGDNTSVTGSWGKGSPVFKATAAMLSFYQAETGEWSREAVRGG